MGNPAASRSGRRAVRVATADDADVSARRSLNSRGSTADVATSMVNKTPK